MSDGNTTLVDSSVKPKATEAQTTKIEGRVQEGTGPTAINSVVAEGPTPYRILTDLAAGRTVEAKNDATKVK